MTTRAAEPSAPQHLRLGIDLGGTKVEVAVIDQHHDLVLRRREATPVGSYAETLALIGRLVTETETELGRRTSIGVASPGARSPTSGRLRNSNSTCLNERPLKEDLETLLGREIRLANDANCFALSEAVDGAAAGARLVFGVILGTGVGGGIVMDRRVIEGANAIAGEWGHNPLPWPVEGEWPGPACYCGRPGCIETFLSGPALARDHASAEGEAIDPRAMAAAAARGDAGCCRSFARFEGRLARALASVINLLDPEVIVLGGGLSNLDRLYENVPPLLAPWVFSDTVRTRVVKNKHGDSSGVRGAAWLWP